MKDVAEQKPSIQDIGSTSRLDGVVIGVLAGLAPEGRPLVDFPGNPGDDAILARSTCALNPEDVGREVALLFEGADPIKPLLVGLISARDRDHGAPQSIVVHRDAERIELIADREIVLRCGSASIRLTRAGKILIRGEYISSHSSGVNRVKGGAVHIN